MSRNPRFRMRTLVSVAAVLAFAGSAWAKPVPQQKPGDPPVVTNNVDRPETDSDAVLALKSMTMPITATPPDKLPLDKLHLPDGFKLEVYASGLANGRSMQLGDKGTLFVGSRIAGRVYAVTERDGKREVKIVAKGLHRPNGVAFHDGTLYIAEVSKISKMPEIEANLDHPPAPVTVYEDLPKDEAHGWKFIKVGPDGKLYVPVGAPGNSLIPPDTHAQIRRMDLDGKNVEVIARGVRNTVGFDWNPKTRQLWFTDNGRDWISEDLPNDELNVLAEPGKQHFGFPYCHQGNFTDPEYGWGHSCEEFTAPVTLLGAHTASLGMRFSTGAQFPEAYRNGIFIAQHGSWNRTKKSGAQVVFAKLDDSGKVVSVEPFLTGFLENNELIGRPVDVQVAGDGTLLVSDDLNGAIYRVSYDAHAKHASK
ncbi:MAG: repeat containing protein [Methylobacterium sp.]|jgi:glucose/arabinose dehydrogenase|nr:repeat containing protein [Methylobacterium sp.]